MTNLRARVLVFIALLGCVVASVIAIASHRLMTGDGGTYVLSMLHERTFRFEFSGPRFASWVLAVPSYLFLRAGFSNTAVMTAWESVVTFHPLASLLFCFWLLYRRRRLALFVFPLLSFALGTSVALPMAFLPSNEIMSLFWPACLYMYTLRKPSVPGKMGVFILLLGLSVGHEAGILALAVIAWISLRAAGSSGFHKAVIGGCIAGALACAWRVSTVHYAHRKGFFLFLQMEGDPFPWLAIAGSLLCGILFAWPPNRLPRARAVLLAGLMICPWFYFLSDPGPTIAHAHFERGLSVMTAIYFGILMVLLEPEEATSWPLVAAACFLFVAARRDVQISERWNEATTWIRQEIRARPYCHVIARKEYEAALKSRGMFDPFVPAVSILLQDTATPVVLFSGTTLETGDRDPCDLLFSKKRLRLGPWSRRMDRGYFRFGS